MTRAALLSFAVIGSVVMAAPQQPAVQNAKMESRTVTSLDRDVAQLASAATDPVWVAWRVPIVDGEHNVCCYNSWDNNGDRGWNVGCGLEPQPTLPPGPSIGSDRPQFPAQAGPVKLEGGTGLIVLLRLVDNKIERMKTLSDDCPMDAGGRSFYWLNGATSAASIQYLRTLVVHTDASSDPKRALSDRALSAIALHRDPSAEDALVAIAHMQDDVHLRSQALIQLGRRGGPKAVAELQASVDREPNADVRRSALSGIMALPNGDGIPMLIALAKSSKDAGTRKDAMSRLSGSKDPRVLAFFEDVIKR